MKAILLLSSSFGAALATFALQLVLSRLLEPDSFGQLAFANSIVIIIGTFACSGISALILRRSCITPEEYQENLETGLKAIATVCSTAFILCTIILMANKIGAISSLLLSAGIFSLSAQSLLTTQGQIRNSPLQIAASQTSLPAFRAAASLALFLITPSFSAAAYITGTTNAISTILYKLKLNKNRSKTRIKISTIKVANFIKSSIKYSINGSINIAQLQLSTAIAGAFYGLTYAGYIAICNTLLTAIYIGPNTIFSTHLQKQYHTLKPEQYSIPLKHASISFIAGIFISLALYVSADTIFPLLFGTQYQEAISILKFLCLAVPFRFFTTAIGAAILSENLVKLKILAAGTGLAIQVVMFTVLSPMGSKGISTSIVVSEIIIAALYLTIYWKSHTK